MIKTTCREIEWKFLTIDLIFVLKTLKYYLVQAVADLHKSHMAIVYFQQKK